MSWKDVLPDLPSIRGSSLGGARTKDVFVAVGPADAIAAPADVVRRYLDEVLERRVLATHLALARATRARVASTHSGCPCSSQEDERRPDAPPARVRPGGLAGHPPEEGDPNISIPEEGVPATWVRLARRAGRAADSGRRAMASLALAGT